MARMLGASRIVDGHKLCACRQCRGRREKPGVSSWHRMVKRSARRREEKLWRREADR